MSAGPGRGAAGALVRFAAFAALLLVLLVVLVFATLPLADAVPYGSVIVQVAAEAVAATVAGVVLLVWLDKRRPGALGIGWTSRTPAEWGTGLLIGLGAIGLATVVLLLAGRVTYSAEAGSPASWLGAVTWHFGFFAVAAYAEEAMFRGYAYQALVRGFGAVPATVFASGAFALAHGANPNVDALAMVNIFLAGVLLSVAYLRTLSLWFATAVHLGWNWGMASLLDLPVSGLTMFETPLYEPVIRGPHWFSGGEFGPEAGLVGTLAFAGALLAVMKMKRVAPAAELLALRPLVEERRGTG